MDLSDDAGGSLVRPSWDLLVDLPPKNTLTCFMLCSCFVLPCFQPFVSSADAMDVDSDAEAPDTEGNEVPLMGKTPSWRDEVRLR